MGGTPSLGFAEGAPARRLVEPDHRPSSSDSVSKIWGRTVAAAQRRGRVPPINDSWIAANCLAHGLPLATLNTKDFLDLADYEGLTLLTN